MDREKIVERAYQKGKELTIRNRKYLGWLEKFFDLEYAEDVGSGDITSEAVLEINRVGKAVLKAKQSGLVGGIEEVGWFCEKHNLEVKKCIEDAGELSYGSPILEIQGRQKDILATERIGLNVLQRMSGIATETRNLIDLLEGYNTKIAATRKTPLKYLDKKAVFLGGGLTHRFGLWDSILIKDNHLEALKKEGIKNCVEKAIDRASLLIEEVEFIEIETTFQEDVIKAAREFRKLDLDKPCIIMLDNVRPIEIEQTIKKLRDESLYDYVLLEASGRITGENIRDYAKTGIDVVSLGSITHSTKILDMSLEMFA